MSLMCVGRWLTAFDLDDHWLIGSNPGGSSGQVVTSGDSDKCSDVRCVFAGRTRASFTGVTPVLSHRVLCSEKPVLGFMLHSHHLEILSLLKYN